MLSGIAVWRLGTKYSTAKKVGYLILAEKIVSKWISLNSCNINLNQFFLIQGLLTKQRQLKYQNIIVGKQPIK